MSFLLRICLVSLGLFAFSLSAQAETYKDWMVSCDNTLACTAIGANGHGTYWRIHRDAGPQGKLESVFRLDSFNDDYKTPPVTAFQIKVGDQTILRLEKQIDSNWHLTEDQTRVLIAKAGNQDQFVLNREQATGNSEDITLSLSGLNASLLAMDDKQKRIGTVTALFKSGSKPASSVPAAPPMPLIKNHPSDSMEESKIEAMIPALRKQLGESFFIECYEPSDQNELFDNAAPLTNGQVLIGLYCYSGAYNIGNAYWIAPLGDVTKAHPLTLPTAYDEQQDDNILVNSDFDPATGVLSFFSKGRGIGDCGTLGSYVWNGDTFVLRQFSEMQDCVGISPDDWIERYRSQGQPLSNAQP